MISANELRQKMEENKKCMGVALNEEIKSALKYIENEITREAKKGKNEIEIWYANICVAVREDLKKYIEGEYLIKCTTNDYAIGLTWKDGKTMNGKESEFYIKK